MSVAWLLQASNVLVEVVVRLVLKDLKPLWLEHGLEPPGLPMTSLWSVHVEHVCRTCSKVQLCQSVCGANLHQYVEAFSKSSVLWKPKE